MSLRPAAESMSMKKLKLLLWSPNGSGLDYGGPGMTAYRLFSANKTDMLSISLAHGRAEQKQYELFKDSYYFGSVQSPVSHYLNPVYQKLFIEKSISWIKENAKNFDVMYGLQGFHVTVLPAVTAQKNNLPSLLKLVQSDSDLSNKSGWKRIFNAPKKRRKLIHSLSGVVSISQAITQELLNMGYPEEKIAYIPNGVDSKQFSPVSSLEKTRLKSELGWKDIPTILFVGAVIPRKQSHLLLEVLYKLKKRGLEAQLVIAGPEKDVNYSALMREMAELYGITENIVWHGFSSDVAALYQASDIFSLLSKKEGMPNAMLEAMSSGLPVVMTDISGVVDAVEHGVNGFIVSEDCEEISEVIVELLKSSELASTVSAAARDTITNTFSSEVVFNKQFQMFDHARNGKSICMS